MTKVLLISPDIIGDKMAGPGIRYWNFSKELAKYHDVTLVTPNECSLRCESFSIIKYKRSILKKLLNDFDVIIIQGVTLFKNSFLKKSKANIVIDLYDPFIFEMLEVRKNPSEYKVDLAILTEQLRNGDYFICASEKQKDLWIGMLALLNKINLTNNHADLSQLIGTVPFGIDNQMAVNEYNPYIDKFKLSEEDKIVLWGGGLWNWLDPLSLIEAVSILAQKRNDIKLVFMGMKHPNDLIGDDVNVSRQAVELSDKLGLTGKSVFFNYDWVPFNERQNYYLNAHVGVSLHYETLETRFSFRTRVLDYIWCQLPMILSEGDLISEIIVKHDCGVTVREKDISGIVERIGSLLDNKDKYNQIKKNLLLLSRDFYWEKAIGDLNEYCLNPPSKEGKNTLFFVKEYFKEKSLLYSFIKIKFSKVFSKKGFSKAINYMKS